MVCGKMSRGVCDKMSRGVWENMSRCALVNSVVCLKKIRGGGGCRRAFLAKNPGEVVSSLIGSGILRYSSAS